MLAQRSVDGIKSCIGTERKKTGIKLINKLKIDYYPTEHLIVTFRTIFSMGINYLPLCGTKFIWFAIAPRYFALLSCSKS